MIAEALAVALALPAAGDRYAKDFDFLVDTVKQHAALLRAKKIDWDAVAKEFEPRFAACADDVAHVRNVMEMLATLKDSHTGVLDSKVDWSKLPGKFDGLYGGGLWFGFDDGKFVLRAWMKDHALKDQLVAGSLLLAIDGMPAWLAMEKEHRRVASFQGISSAHSFFASLGNRMLPFGDKQQVELLLLVPEGPAGKVRKVQCGRWGPGGKAFYPAEAFLPEGTSHAEGAVSAAIETPFAKNAGWIKITGSMDDATVKAFDATFDARKGMTALFLDCRGMGGGSDDCAWTMCGRLFPKATANGNQRRLEPTGSWQFDGPAVMLQDETEVSSAETFTWALSETGRVISVGRPTGGWGIIPQRFDLPSGLASFRIGVNDRGTPVRGIHTEGVGWPPDVPISFGPELCALPDPERVLGEAILAALASGQSVAATRDAFHALFADGNVKAFRAWAAGVKNAKGFDAERLVKLAVADLKGELALEEAALNQDDAPPDPLSAQRRAARLQSRAKSAGVATSLDGALKALKSEAAAQDALLATLDARFEASDKARKAFLAKHGNTRTGKYARETLWR